MEYVYVESEAHMPTTVARTTACGRLGHSVRARDHREMDANEMATPKAGMAASRGESPNMDARKEISA